ncbi:MAG: transporter [Nitrospirae bacterium]|nr:transporter [Nitrospirota bacterium]
MLKKTCGKKVVSILVICLALLHATTTHAAHPLITDDTGTQGKGKFQIEINAEHAGDSGNTETALGATFTAGLLDNLDIVISSPYILFREKDETGRWYHENGISDLSLAVKWRSYDHEGLSLALKPGVTIPTGNENKGLGDGKPDYSLFFITTKELEPFTLHLNLGYIANRKEIRDIWHYSLAGEYAASKNIRIVGNIGGETTPDRTSRVNPLFALAGLIYKVADNFDIDFGIKTGLNKAEADYTLMAGIAFRF